MQVIIAANLPRGSRQWFRKALSSRVYTSEVKIKLLRLENLIIPHLHSFNQMDLPKFTPTLATDVWFCCDLLC